MFLAREAAELWLRSSDGQECVVRLRERPQRAHLVANADPSLAAARMALAAGV
jgi:hypothetical protein